MWNLSIIKISRAGDNIFYLDTFEVSTLGNSFSLTFSESDTKEIHNLYADKIDINSISEALEKKLGISINTSEFVTTVKNGPISENDRSYYENKYGIKYSRWKSAQIHKHKNQLIIYYSLMIEDYYVKNSFLPEVDVYIFLLVDGKYVKFIKENGYTNTSIQAAQAYNNTDKSKWMDFYHNSLSLVNSTLLKEIDKLKK